MTIEIYLLSAIVVEREEENGREEEIEKKERCFEEKNLVILVRISRNKLSDNRLPDK